MTTAQAPSTPVPTQQQAAGSGLLHSLLDFAQSHQDRLAETAADLGLTVPQARALYHVAAAPTVRKLAVELHCDASYVTGLVDRLEGRKLMKREVDPADRRVKKLTLTTAGKRVRTKLTRAFDQAPGLDNLSQDEKRELESLLNKVSGSTTSSGFSPN
ncbi:MarR family winged helix-turn-helix transcriptional regulator [Streptomyces sp. NPDC048172]|uniref:MarR family winged helix-turn-helix transcriptional regulator n=1 Tax=Streptomyces sp. NPDC048172 TaxID=3365505 RepID=UPI003717A527